MPSAENNYFPPSFFSNKVCVIRDIMKSKKNAGDSQHFEEKSLLGMSEWRGHRG